VRIGLPVSGSVILINWEYVECSIASRAKAIIISKTDDEAT